MPSSGELMRLARRDLRAALGRAAEGLMWWEKQHDALVEAKADELLKDGVEETRWVAEERASMWFLSARPDLWDENLRLSDTVTAIAQTAAIPAQVRAAVRRTGVYAVFDAARAGLRRRQLEGCRHGSRAGLPGRRAPARRAHARPRERRATRRARSPSSSSADDAGPEPPPPLAAGRAA
jgi:hypothetical protein